MRKIICSLMSISLVVGMPLVANASAAYNQFKKTQFQEFSGDKAPQKCPLKKLEVTEDNNKVKYELCAVSGRPIFIRASSGDITYAFYQFRKGKLVQISYVDHFVSTGLRNEQPVVRWNDIDKTVNYKLGIKTKTATQQEVNKIKKILISFKK
ncbi:hypothetical protein DSM106972_092140 [Dulcicalothrix desertica PCC 7102]|uniref:Lipoprotein n=1 Tax=Dulcicalothrix desertica PCC 7102 TaxID=232991 RepID=A0A3S1IBL4_9CYAN|nr:hypothetical protein [Dulcicalothrix desertica]RUS94963.1 hypothetical protein DSM106972_092140 [Dulcicalothrix desertica PCC 7102]TWH62802.1 hypothetical protein CAL7102_00332 [Dulcicalothrix desertica PCC 7102]